MQCKPLLVTTQACMGVNQVWEGILHKVIILLPTFKEDTILLKGHIFHIQEDQVTDKTSMEK